MFILEVGRKRERKRESRGGAEGKGQIHPHSECGARSGVQSLDPDDHDLT